MRYSLIMRFMVLGVVLGMFAVSSGANANDLGNASGLVFTPGKGYSWPAMGGPVTRYMYDAAGRSHLVEVDPFTLEVRRSPVDPNRLEGYSANILER
ncbi:hypothetical protein [Desulfomonile tiedjei]|uniref:RHS repeat protein n=1 Tax=Desulfomonile tiedjei (strain ATCC 49306 / DSM 6799 / DCB-1) TaxID=706587 RepID=I4C7U5_DESTA|nr:hypothetical protein [Desulfomonile tiedjei]AFM25636.1 hypothetical protein Desti_2967 [Desulfomonile tiedjei DSM 6799]